MFPAKLTDLASGFLLDDQGKASHETQCGSLTSRMANTRRERAFHAKGV